MNSHNISRLQEMARLRRTLSSSYVAPEIRAYIGRCVQCNDEATTRHTDMVSGVVTLWCDNDYDHWWMALTYLPQIRSGEIDNVTQLLVYPDNFSDSDWQLEGWPN